ncbi:uncharacterized protein EAF02_005030 [Botrytis sinoallii]|uniref:uncharacterized protein n=1 Tax=Botrytis sinoallii TaxID=1463999 RepID=UPI0019005D7D|nr:uncharacterized protein EAF02_005030 [Botrytis sinoallii]KAF7884694.1 hypothetical protein EAF02_005030 [Botrytis sinoallii]
MKNDWFIRRWVIRIQELALAKNSSIRMKQILNKSMRTDFEKLRKPTEYLGALDARALGANTLVTTASCLFRRSDDGRIEQRLLSLEILVTSMLLAFEATDPRDTIFTILSIAKDTGNLGSKLDTERRWLDFERRRGVIKILMVLLEYVVWPFFNLFTTLFYTQSSPSMAVLDPRIQPNYQKCLSDVYADFIEYCIQMSNSLDILCRHRPPDLSSKTLGKRSKAHLKRRKCHLGLPVLIDESGRPQYNASSRLAPLVRLGKKINYDLKDDEIDPTIPGEPGVEPIYAKKQEDIQLRHKFDGIMYVEGFQLDVINRRSDAVTGGIITAEALKMGGCKKDPLTGKYEPHDALWRTLVGDRGPDGVNASNWYRRACAYCLEKKRHRQPCFNF